MPELKCPSCQAVHEIPSATLSDEGTVVQCPECGSSFTALPSGVTLQPESSQSQSDPPEEPDRGIPFITDEPERETAESGSSEVDAAMRQKVQRALERPNLSPLEDELKQDGGNPLRQAVIDSLTELEQEKQEEALREAAREGHETVVEALLDGGVDPNAADEEGKTALHHAAVSISPGVVRILLGTWADPNTTDEIGTTPLHLAVLSAAGSHEVARLPELGTWHGEKIVEGTVDLWRLEPGELALQGEKYLKISIDLSSDKYVYIRNTDERVLVQHIVEEGDVVRASEEIARFVKGEGVPTDRVTGAVSVIQKLIDSGANVNSFDKGDATPLDCVQIINYSDDLDNIKRVGNEINKHGGYCNLCTDYIYTI